MWYRFGCPGEEGFSKVVRASARTLHLRPPKPLEPRNPFVVQGDLFCPSPRRLEPRTMLVVQIPLGRQQLSHQPGPARGVPAACQSVWERNNNILEKHIQTASNGNVPFHEHVALAF